MERRHELLLPARNPDHRRAVAEVPAQLTVDRRRGIRGEGDPSRRVEAPGGGDEPDRCDLHEIFERLAAAGVAPGEASHERQVPPHEIEYGIRSSSQESIVPLFGRKFKRFLRICIDLLPDGYFKSDRTLCGRSLRISSARSRNRLAATGVAVTALALGLAAPAHADTPPEQSVLPALLAIAVPEAPTPPDTSQAAAAVAAAAAQLGAANINVSVRIASPGDNGAVTQAVSAAADAAAQAAPAQTAVQAADTQQTAVVAATATQTAPSNVNVSVRIASPGADGPSTQTIDAAATANAAPDPQYQPDAASISPRARAGDHAGGSGSRHGAFGSCAVAACSDSGAGGASRSRPGTVEPAERLELELELVVRRYHGRQYYADNRYWYPGMGLDVECRIDVRAAAGIGAPYSNR